MGIASDHACSGHLGERSAPQRTQQVRAPLHLIGERQDRQIESEALKALALTVEWQTIDILVDEELRDEPRPSLPLATSLSPTGAHTSWPAHG